MSLRNTAFGLALGLLIPAVAGAEPGVTPDTVTFGQVAAFEGPAAALGTGMRAGIIAAFEEANAAGGVNGRRLALETADDGYEPNASAEAVKAMLASGGVFGLIGPVGTPTSKATQPLATEAGAPFVGAFTGAGFLRDPTLQNVINLRASYGAETEAWIAHLVDKEKLTKIAILYQDDAFGRVGLDGVTAALAKRNMTLVAEGTFTRNTVAVKSALLEIRKSEPEAVVMVGPYKPMAEFIKLARKIKFNPTFVNISFVGSKALAEELGPDGDGVIVSQVVPLPWDDTIPVVARYRAALAAHQPDAEPDFVSLEGYLTGLLAIAALEAAGSEPTREGFLAAARGMSARDLGGVTLSFGPEDNQGLDSVFLTRIEANGGFALVRGPGA